MGMKSAKSVGRPHLPVSQGQSLVMKPEEVRRLQSDLDVLSARLGQPPRLASDGSAAGSIVNELRTAVSDARGSAEVLSVQAGSKIDLIEAVLAKVTELDRAILRETEPVTDGPVKTRRNSKNGEISILPLHLQVVDRLVDLHTQSKRPVVIHTQVAQKSKPTAEDVSAIETMKAIHAHEKSELESRLAHMHAKCTEMEGRLTSSHSEIEGLRKEKIAIEKRNAEIAAQLTKLNEACAASAACAESSSPSSNSELDGLVRKYDELKAMCKVMEHQLDAEAAVRPKVLNAMIKIAGDLSDQSNLKFGNVSSYFHGENKDSEYFNAFDRLLTAVEKRLASLHGDMQAAVTNSQLLESELQSARLEKQMLSDDYNAVCGNLNTLNTAFSEMQTELIQLKVKLDTAKETQKRSESSDLKLLTANCELRALRDARSDLEVQVEDLRRDKNKLDAQVAVQAKEIEQYKAMVDRMKQKIRDLTPTDKREFLDSFEEVMREEMATMREAFEHKLRTAKGEVEALSKKHQQDLARIRESHSSAGRL